MKNKKGELTTQQIVVLVVLIASFAVLLYFIFHLNLGNETDAEICHNSVVTRGSVNLLSGSFPLKCSRQYVCLTTDGSCESMTNPEIIKVKTKEEVYATLADEMATCWWMFGEGKFDYVGKNFWKKENYCSICDQISFDNSLKKISEFKEGRIDKDDVYDYLAKTQYSEKQTYSDYLFGTNDLNALKTALSKNQNAEVNFGTIDFEKQYYVMMGITSEVSGRVWKLATAGVVTVAGIFIPGVGWTWAGAIVGAAIIGGGEYGALQGPEILSIAVEGDGVPNTFMAPTIVEVNSEELKALNCDSITTLS